MCDGAQLLVDLENHNKMFLEFVHIGPLQNYSF